MSLRDIRQSYKWDELEASARSGIDVETYINIENGSDYTNNWAVEMILSAFDVDYEDVVF